MKIKYFAWLKEITKVESELCDDSKILNINDLKKFIVSKYPEMKKHLNEDLLRIAVNKDYIVENISLNSDDEIAVFPPVSGG